MKSAEDRALSFSAKRLSLGFSLVGMGNQLTMAIFWFCALFAAALGSLLIFVAPLSPDYLYDAPGLFGVLSLFVNPFIFSVIFFRMKRKLLGSFLVFLALISISGAALFVGLSLRIEFGLPL